MKRCALRHVVVTSVVLLLMTVASVGQESTAPAAVTLTLAEVLPAVETAPPSRVVPNQMLADGRELVYGGTFAATGKFRGTSKWDRFRESMASNPRCDQPICGGAPPWMVGSSERAVADFVPFAHGVSVAVPQSRFSGLRDPVVTFAYGGAAVLRSPRYVTTDSKHRLIVSDPEIYSVHVLDPQGKTSFRIQGGKGNRLQRPAGVAVDAADNIYVADAERGMVLVYDEYGRFVRYVGMFHGENMYQQPAGIAIDREARRLYLADSPRNLVLILDLEGTPISTIGKRRNGTGLVELQNPTEIALGRDEIDVLDGNGHRVLRLTRDGKPLGSFYIGGSYDRKADTENGLALDAEGNVYVSSASGSVITMYSREGKPIHSFGHPGVRKGEFRQPKGIWVDAKNQMYVADSLNDRVQVFQITAAQ